MFRIREIIHDGIAEKSKRQLPLLFPSRAEVIAHIEALQIQFPSHGLNLEQCFGGPESTM
jgi:hypothetical protein